MMERSAKHALTQYNAESCRDEETEQGEKIHEDEVLQTLVLAKGECGSEVSDNGVGADTPASIGQIHNDFAEKGYNR